MRALYLWVRVRSILGWTLLGLAFLLFGLGAYGWLRREIPETGARLNGGPMRDCRVLEVDGQKFWSCKVEHGYLITVPCTQCQEPPKWIAR